jgi:hypothetical protein
MCVKEYVVMILHLIESNPPLPIEYAKITVIHRDFSEAIKCSFCEITVDHRDSGVSTMIANIG